MSEAIAWWMMFVAVIVGCSVNLARSQPKDNERLIEVLDELIEAKKEIIRLKQERDGR